MDGWLVTWGNPTGWMFGRARGSPSHRSPGPSATDRLPEGRHRPKTGDFLRGNAHRVRRNNPNRPGDAGASGGARDLTEATGNPVAKQNRSLSQPQLAFDHVVSTHWASPLLHDPSTSDRARSWRGSYSGDGPLRGWWEVLFTTTIILRTSPAAARLVCAADTLEPDPRGPESSGREWKCHDPSFTDGREAVRRREHRIGTCPRELNWLRVGQHHGFPWRIGSDENQAVFFSLKIPKWTLLDSRFNAACEG